MSRFIQAIEYREEGFAIVVDTAGKYVVTKDNPNIIPLPEIQNWRNPHSPCSLLQSRDSMLT